MAKCKRPLAWCVSADGLSIVNPSGYPVGRMNSPAHATMAAEAPYLYDTVWALLEYVQNGVGDENDLISQARVAMQRATAGYDK